MFAYGRYMDDGFIISNDLDKLKQLKIDLINIVENKLKLKINSKKTIIKKLSHEIVFLKARFLLLDSGKVIIKPPKKYITKNKSKFKKLKLKYNKPKEYLDNLFNSIYCNLKYYNANKVKNRLKCFYEKEIT